MSAFKYLMWVNSCSKEDEGGQTAVSAENSFVSLNPGENILPIADLHVTGKALLVEVGEKCSLCLRETKIHRWREADRVQR